VAHPHDVEGGRVGLPLPCCEIKLVDVPEMGYTHNDKDEQGNPAPRGEILISGSNVTLGYYGLQDKTDEVYTKDRQGKR
jgi:long-chain acyl-CoA synthetase